MTIVITGGSGFIGTELTKALLEKEHTIIVIDKRGPTLTHQNLFFIPCDLEKNTLPFNVLERTDAIIHLAGRKVSGKLTDKVKQQIRDSRVQPTKHIIESLKQTINKPLIFISASAVGFYDDTGDKIVDEKSTKGEGFFSDVVSEWETQAKRAEEFGCRVVMVRTAIVLGKKGFLSSLWKTARAHIVIRISKKNFWMPWIHINDVVRIYMFALETNTLQGPVNAVSPTQTQYFDFIKAFSKETKSILFSKIPFAKAILGDPTIETAVNHKAFPQRLTDKGFIFSFTDINQTIKAIKNDKS